ncbi:MAG: hypothetical protein ABMA64_31805 [Myxococcota bacterium]
MISMSLGFLWFGCSAAPTFTSIGSVTVMVQTPGGTSRRELEGDQLQKVQQCLYQTVEIEQAEASAEYLQELMMLEVKDRLGDRMFELYTKENLKGNRNKYYRNTCILKLIRES